MLPSPNPPGHLVTHAQSSILPCSSPGSLGRPCNMPAVLGTCKAGTGGPVTSHSNPHAVQLATGCRHYQCPSDFEASLGGMASIARACQSGALGPGPNFASDLLCSCGQVPACLWASLVPFVQWREWGVRLIPSQSTLGGNLAAMLLLQTWGSPSSPELPHAPVGGGLLLGDRALELH